MKKETVIKQRDITDCGAACLASVSSFYDLKIPVSRIRQIAGTDKRGTNALGMIEAAGKLGFSAKGVRGDASVIPDIPTPSIAHVILKNSLHHYVVIYKTSPKEVQVMDPGLGKVVKYKIEEFLEIWSGVLILLTPDETFEKRDEKVSVSSRFWFLIKPHRATILQSIVGAIVFTLVGLTTSIYVQKIIDVVLPSGNTNMLNLLSVGMLILILIQIVVNAFKSVFILKTGQQLDAKLILGYYKHLLSLPQRFFDTMRVGEIISRVNDAVKIRVFINEAGVDILINCFIVLFSFGLMFTYYWKLAVIILLVIPLYGSLYWIANHLNKKVERKVMEKSAELESQLVESLNSIKTIKYFGMQNYANLKTEIRFVELLNTIYRSGMNSIFSGNGAMTISKVFTIILLWVGTGFVMRQQITPGELMSFYAIVGYFTGPVSGLIGANKTYQNAKIAADRLFEIMDLESERQDDRFEIIRDEVGEVQFQDVKFRYGTRVTVFENLNLTIPKGQFLAIAGESGSGKSTIAALMRNLYPLDQGKITTGGYDLNKIKPDLLNQYISIVPQQIDLFTGTVVENIALGEFEPDIKRIIKLAEQIGAINFLNELPGGLHARLSENGLNLSGGQRQRLAILRALYANPEIVIFDEATAALDAKSEELIVKVMLALKDQGKTVIAITHRMNAAVVADRVILLDRGQIVVDGRHEELMLNSDQYANYWQSTFSGMMPITA